MPLIRVSRQERYLYPGPKFKIRSATQKFFIVKLLSKKLAERH